MASKAAAMEPNRRAGLRICAPIFSRYRQRRRTSFVRLVRWPLPGSVGLHALLQGSAKTDRAMMLAKQVTERLIGKLLEARKAIPREHVERSPGFVVEFDELAPAARLLRCRCRRHGDLPLARRASSAQLAAITLTRLSAMSVSFLSVAFSSWSVCSRI